MGVDLLGEHGDESFNWSGWRTCMERAIEFGWTPEGTVAPTDFPGEWKGGYCSNDFQMVTDRDARALGEALLRAIAALSARERDKVQVRREWPNEVVEVLRPTDPVEALLRAVGALPAQERDKVQVRREWPNEGVERADEQFAELRCLRRLANYALKGGFVIA